MFLYTAIEAIVGVVAGILITVILFFFFTETCCALLIKKGERLC